MRRALAWGGLLVGAGVALLLYFVGYRTPGRVGATAVSLAWSGLAGVFGLLLFLLWTPKSSARCARPGA